MQKRVVTVVLILGILLTFTGPAFSARGPKIVKPGPTVTQAHPWGDSGYTGYTPPCYRAGSGSGYREFMVAPTFTNFVLQFYLKYVVKKAMEGQSSIRQQGKSE